VSEDPGLIRHEDEIVWTEDVDLSRLCAGSSGSVCEQSAVSRLLEGARTVHRQRHHSRRRPGEAAGWRFARRVFWGGDGGRSEAPERAHRFGAPAEAVDPRTVAPKVWGDLTGRAWGGPLPRLAEAGRE
jgi:hypothetical protein